MFQIAVEVCIRAVRLPVAWAVWVFAKGELTLEMKQVFTQRHCQCLLRPCIGPEGVNAKDRPVPIRQTLDEITRGDFVLNAAIAQMTFADELQDKIEAAGKAVGSYVRHPGSCATIDPAQGVVFKKCVKGPNTHAVCYEPCGKNRRLSEANTQQWHKKPTVLPIFRWRI
ncbi:hypothetical protein N4R57_17600 [Rhodobacteraceae bacterium D3-12]|nr:hypothetical protein N4R57_17600 [Rhodobacteraceae bacterium D3-12]